MKPGKVLCCIFLLVILENLAKYKTWLCVLLQLINRSKDYAIHAQSMSIKQKMCRAKGVPT